MRGVETDAGPIETDTLVLAIGHSARDTFGMLRSAGLTLEAKPFSVGFRAEHLQSEIDRALYHEAAGHPALPPGEYQLSAHPGAPRVYTFCMCPGGRVVAAASEAGGVCTNGMSYHARDGANANAAVVAEVKPEEFGGDPMRAVAFQRELERAAFALRGDYTAPAQDLESFLAGRPGLRLGRVAPTYPRGVAAADLGALFPRAAHRRTAAGAARLRAQAAGLLCAGYPAHRAGDPHQQPGADPPRRRLPERPAARPVSLRGGCGLRGRHRQRGGGWTAGGPQHSGNGPI